MIVHTPADLGAVIRERRKELKLDQADLAQQIGTGGQWISGIEQGHSQTELGLVLRALDALGIRLDTAIASPTHKNTPDLDAIVSAARKNGK